MLRGFQKPFPNATTCVYVTHVMTGFSFSSGPCEFHQDTPYTVTEPNPGCTTPGWIHSLMHSPLNTNSIVCPKRAENLTRLSRRYGVSLPQSNGDVLCPWSDAVTNAVWSIMVPFLLINNNGTHSTLTDWLSGTTVEQGCDLMQCFPFLSYYPSLSDTGRPVLSSPVDACNFHRRLISVQN